MVIFGLKDRPRDYLALSVIKLAARLGLAPRSPRLTGAPLTLADLAIKMVGHLGTAPSISWSQARRVNLSHSCPINWRIAEGSHPKPLPRFHLFSRQVPPTAAFTIHKVALPAGIAPAPPVPQTDALSAELRENKLRVRLPGDRTYPMPEWQALPLRRKVVET